MPDARKRPGSVTFVAIALIVLGGVALAVGLVEVPLLAVIASADAPAGAARGAGQLEHAAVHHAIAREVPGYFPAMIAISIVSLLLGIAQLLCGIGLLKLRPHARTWALWIVLGKLVYALASNGYQAFIVGPVERRIVAANLVPAGEVLPFDLGAIMGGLLVVVEVVTMILQIAIALTLLLVLLSATVRQAFAPSAVPLVEAEPPVPPRSPYEGYEDEGELPPDAGIADRI